MASVEAMATLPVFVVLFIAVFYVQKLMVAQQTASTQARSCAWLYSANNCTSVPPGCDGVVKVADGSFSTPKLDDAKSAIKSSLKGDVDDLQSSTSEGIVSEVVGKLLGPMINDAFGRSLDSNSSQTIARPLLFGGNTTQLTGHYHLGCNLAHTTPEQVAMDAWDTFKP